MSVEEIESAISRLNPVEMAQLRAWFDRYDQQLWDAQIERDVAAGRLDRLAEAALGGHAQGRSTEM